MNPSQIISVLFIVGAILVALGFICHVVLIGSFIGEKMKDGYAAYVSHTFKNPGAFFTYVFKELEPGSWRRRLVKPWLIGLILGIILLVVAAKMSSSSWGA